MENKKGIQFDRTEKTDGEEEITFLTNLKMLHLWLRKKLGSFFRLANRIALMCAYVSYNQYRLFLKKKMKILLLLLLFDFNTRVILSFTSSSSFDETIQTTRAIIQSYVW